jgi:hypothetical protein
MRYFLLGLVVVPLTQIRFIVWEGQRPLVPFSDYTFLVHHPVNRDDQHLLAFANSL